MAWVGAAVINARSKQSLIVKNEEWCEIDIEADEIPIDQPKKTSLEPQQRGVSNTDARARKNTEVRIYENQRWYPHTGWGSPNNNGDPAPWTSPHGWTAVKPDLFEMPGSELKKNGKEEVSVLTYWAVDHGQAPLQDEGFRYAYDFRSEFHCCCSTTDLVRRRVWFRYLAPQAKSPQRKAASTAVKIDLASKIDSMSSHKKQAEEGGGASLASFTTYGGVKDMGSVVFETDEDRIIDCGGRHSEASETGSMRSMPLPRKEGNPTEHQIDNLPSSRERDVQEGKTEEAGGDPKSDEHSKQHDDPTVALVTQELAESLMMSSDMYHSAYMEELDTLRDEGLMVKGMYVAPLEPASAMIQTSSVLYHSTYYNNYLGDQEPSDVFEDAHLAAGT